MRASGFLTLLIGFFVLVPPVSASGSFDEDRVLATADGDPVTARDLMILLGRQPVPRKPEDAAKISADGLLTRLIQNRLLEHEGLRLGLDETPEIRGQVRDVRHHLAMMALLDSVSAGVADPEPEPTVEAAPITSRMFRVSHILLKTEGDALALRDSLDTGVPFAELAERHSLDTEWTGPDGDLGWAREDKFIPEFGAVLPEMATGDVSAPVKTEQGWHLLWLSESRTETLPQDGAMAQAAQREERRQRVMEVVRAYVDSLKSKYGVVANDSLLAALDYGSEDPGVQKRLKDSDEILVHLPWKDLTVSQFTRNLRFENFHGLAGKPDAPQIRDKSLEEWVTESLLRHEAVQLGFDRRPDIVAAGREAERDQLREKVGRMILDIRFDPDEAEVERYYRDHAERFSPPPSLKVSGVVLSGPDAARSFRQRLEAGAQLGWLAERTPEVVDRSPAMFANWLAPEELGLDDAPEEPGQLIGPFEIPGGWAVARVSDVSRRAPLPLDQCRPQVLAAMKSERMQEAMTTSLSRLEDEATLKIADGAEAVVKEGIDRWLETSARRGESESGSHGGSPHGGMPHMGRPGGAREGDTP